MDDDELNKCIDTTVIPIRNEDGKLLCNCSYADVTNPVIIFKNTSIPLSDFYYKVTHPKETRHKKIHK